MTDDATTEERDLGMAMHRAQTAPIEFVARLSHR